MPSARYWRLSGITSRGGTHLELGQLELWGMGAKLTATLTCAVAPITGTLANLSDADLATKAKFALCPGLAFVFDLGAAAIADTPRFGAADLPEFVEAVALESSSDTITWTLVTAYNRVVYPGAGILSQLVSPNPVLTNPATWDGTNKGSACILTNALLTATGSEANGTAKSTLSVSSGKWYWEVSSIGSRYPIVGVGNASATLIDFPGADASGWGYYGLTAKKITGGTQTAYGTAWDNPAHVIGFALDADAGTLEVFKNGISMGVMFTGMTGPYYAMTGGDSGAPSNATANFGATPFTHPVPDGYQPGVGVFSTITENMALATLALTDGVITNLLPPAFETLDCPPLVSAGGNISGTSQITGTVKVTPATPVSRKVRLHREVDGLLVSEVWSDPITGAYTFANLNPDFAYTVLSYDHTEAFRAVVADRVLTEPM